MAPCHKEDHVAILSLGKLYKMLLKLPDDIVPESLPLIVDTLRIGNEILSRLDAEDFSLKEALNLTLMLEKSIAEEHPQSVLKIDHDDKTMRELKKLQVEETTPCRQDNGDAKTQRFSKLTTPHCPDSTVNLLTRL